MDRPRVPKRPGIGRFLHRACGQMYCVYTSTRLWASAAGGGNEWAGAGDVFKGKHRHCNIRTTWGWGGTELSDDGSGVATERECFLFGHDDTKIRERERGRTLLPDPHDFLSAQEKNQFSCFSRLI